MEWWRLLILLVAGAIAGFINSMAGGGSLVTLPMLMLYGLPPDAANGTNRLGILVQAITSFVDYHRSGVKVNGRTSLLLIPLCGCSDRKLRPSRVAQSGHHLRDAPLRLVSIHSTLKMESSSRELLFNLRAQSPGLDLSACRRILCRIYPGRCELRHSDHSSLLGRIRPTPR